jgi:hypothetical protein
MLVVSAIEFCEVAVDVLGAARPMVPLCSPR